MIQTPERRYAAHRSNRLRWWRGRGDNLSLAAPRHTATLHALLRRALVPSLDRDVAREVERRADAWDEEELPLERHPEIDDSPNSAKGEGVDGALVV